MYEVGDVVIRTDRLWLYGELAEIIGLPRIARRAYRVKMLAGRHRGRVHKWVPKYFRIYKEQTKIVWEV
jgi:alkylated DNA nucleotide flippase Atl1